MIRIVRLAAGLSILLVGSAIGSSMAMSDEAERRRICATAEARYQTIYGKPSASEAVAIVKMYKYNFCPADLTVAPGTKVRWVNVDKRTSHSVWFEEAGRAESDRLFPDEVVEFEVDLSAGDHPYLCGPHWEQEGMRGSVTVAPK